MKHSDVNIPEKVIAFGEHALDVSNQELDCAPYSNEYYELCFEYTRTLPEVCSFYRQRFEQAGIDPSTITNRDAFEAIPPMSSGEVSALTDSTLLPDATRECLKTGFFNMPVQKKLWRKFTTSGSSGLRPKVSYYTRDDWEVLVTTGARMLASHIPFYKISRALNCFNGGHVGAKFQEDIFSTLGVSVEGVHISRTTPEAVLEQLAISGAKELGGFNTLIIPPGLPKGMQGASKGTNLDSLLEIDVDNIIGKNIRVILTSGTPREAPGLNLRQRVWEANELAGQERTQFFEMYGFSESLPNAMDCEMNDGLHLAPGPTFTEVLDENTGKHVKSGEKGFVAITGLRNGSRFLRYLVGDEAVYVDEPCKCGKTSPRLKNIERVKEIERLQQGCGGGL
ncbi:phenylacetate--CoA ligase family protein [Pseudoalteromonas sp. T1lg23B]|uniref:phenylacetate--CoA ligase family protein n=1 Tax=Pseudoalteromonas sp. T1lg23B TaxID=2077097 RepID=UPI000CF65207|nr:hypothetical protein [Pseudoalteromonas sp. T1lg23B]